MDKLNNHPLFCFLDDIELALIKSVTRSQRYSPEAMIIQIGNRSRDIICIIKGIVSIRIASPEGGLHEVAVLNEGTIIGDMNFVIPTRRTANVVALTEIEADILPYTELCQLLKAEPMLASKVFTALNLQLQDKFAGMLG